MNPKYIYTSYLKKMPFEKKSTNEDIDPEKFILEVKNRECIWNTKSKSYNLKCHRNRATKRQAWDEIGRVFHANWDNFTPDEKHKKVDSMSRKWANIRKYYTDELRRPSDSPAKKKQRRKYHHLLTFLDNTTYKKRASRIDDFKNISREDFNDESSSDSESNELYIVEDSNELAKLSEKYENTQLPEFNDKPITDPKIAENQDFYPKLFETDSILSNSYEKQYKVPSMFDKKDNTSLKPYVRCDDVLEIFEKQGPNPRTYEKQASGLKTYEKQCNLKIPEKVNSTQKQNDAPKTFETQYNFPKFSDKANTAQKDEINVSYSNVIGKQNVTPKTFENQVSVQKKFERRPSISKLTKPLTADDVKPDVEISLKWNVPVNLVVPNVEKPAKTSLAAARNPEIMRLLTEEPRPPNRGLAITPVITRLPFTPAPPTNPAFFNKPYKFDQNADACKKFLLSLLPEAMAMNGKQNMQFRLGILDLLHDIKFK